MRTQHIIFHLSMYYLAWFSCLWLAANNLGGYAVAIVLITVVAQIAWQVWVVKHTRGLLLLVVLMVTVGVLSDSVLLHLNIIHFVANPFHELISPPWMISLWVSFAIFFYAVLDNFHQRYVVLAALSLVAFPLAYLGGVKMGAATLPQGNVSILIAGVMLAILFPGCLFVYNKFKVESDH
jgi:hypothetical protein